MKRMLHGSGAVLAACVLSQARATDIRDYLPNGRIFEVPAPVFDATYNTTTDHLSMTFVEPGASTIALNVVEWVDSSDRLAFRARPAIGASDDLYQIVGFIDVVATGDYLLEYNVEWLNGSISAGRGWSDEDLITYEGQDCDCEDQVTLGCDTNMCNAESTCSHVVSDKCKWKDVFSIP